MSPDLAPLLTGLTQTAWRIFALAALVYLLVPILWMIAVPEARPSVARLTRNLLIGLGIGVAVLAALPFFMLGLHNPYLPSFLRPLILPCLLLLAVSAAMTLITHWWAARTSPEEPEE